MAFHHAVQRVLLVGIRLPEPPAPDTTPRPAALVPLIEAVAPAQAAFNARAVAYGDRYRSAFWGNYLLVALAVLCAGLPLALGWDRAEHALHHFASIWVFIEVVLIFCVGVVYWRGHAEDWQGQWLVARTQAELSWYLPMIAPLVDFARPHRATSWYACLDQAAQDLPSNHEFETMCQAHSALAQAQVGGVWSDRQFVREYAGWTAAIIERQRDYHRRLAVRQRALRRRVHTVTGWLFGLTGLAALAHLVVHSNALTLATMFLPALGASLHGALAQSEAYRLEAASESIARELEETLVPLKQTLASVDPLETVGALRDAVLSAVSLILEEHHDWHMLVRPHHVPLG